MARPFRLFSTYDFFSVFIPGLATVFGFYLLIPQSITFSLVSAIIPILVLSFVFGQGLHSLAAFIESLLNRTQFVDGHRAQFGEFIKNNPNNPIVKKIKEDCAYLFRDSRYSIPEEETVSEDEWKNLYTYVQSRIYVGDMGRSRTFQAIFAFSRSMTVFLSGLPVLYFTHHVFRENNLIISRPPKYLLYFPSFREFFEAVLPLSWLGALVFLYSTISYKRHFIQYLVSDFVSLNNHNSNN
jgi:hypothetical protein